jgi:hypothetical protein
MFDQMGWSVGSVGDVDGDGVPDWIAGTPYDDGNGFDSGAAQVVSGATGVVLRTILGTDPGDQLGWSVAGIGDVNLDGFPDFVCGAPEDDNSGASSGSARIVSGNAALPLTLTLNGVAAGDRFGAAVASAGDVNGDGWLDVVVGAPNGLVNASNPGYARVFIGPTLTLLATVNGNGDGDQFGSAVDGAGDVNDDGFDDLVIGAPFVEGMFGDNGAAAVHSGEWITKLAAQQTPLGLPILFTIKGDTAGDQFGAAVAGAGDVNGDGFTDVIVGSPYDDPHGSASGSALVAGGPAGATLRFLAGAHAGDFFGLSVAAGDANGDGFADPFVGVPQDDAGGSNAGAATAWSGKDGSLVRTLVGAVSGDQLGHSVCVTGDVDGDGMDDLLVGVIGDDLADISAGSASLFSSQPGSITSYGAGCAGSGGFVPTLTATGAAAPGGALTIRIDDAAGGGPAVFAVGIGKGAFPIKLTGCKLNVLNLLGFVGPAPLTFGGPGAGSLAIDVTVPVTVSPGSAFTLQAFNADAGVLHGFSATNGLEIVID